MSKRQTWKMMAGLLMVTGLLAAFGTSLIARAIDEPATAQVRVAHLAPFAADPDTAVTITLNGDEFRTSFAYGDSTTYVTVPADSYDVEVTVGDDVEPAISDTIMVEAGKIYSVVAIGDGTNQSLDLLVLEDDNTAPAAGQFHLRLGHLAPFAAGSATADVRLQDGTVVADDVNFGGVTGYLPLAAGEYDLKITTPDGATTLIDPAPVTFNEGDIVTAFATGEGTNQDLGVFAWPVDVEGFFLPLVEPEEMTYLRVAHLAPFAAGSGSSVTVSLNGTPALTAFEYGDSTEYLELPAGEYLVEVLPGGGPTVAISATVDLMPDTYYSAAAIGDGANQDLSLQALVDDNTAPAAGQFHLRLGHLAPFAAGSATADVRLQDGTVVADDVDFGGVTGYLPLAAGEYDLKITTPDGATTLIDPAPVTFNEGDIVTAFATGEGTNQDLGVFAWPVDVEGFFLPLAEPEEMTYLRVAHLAPFAAGSGSSVTVSLNGTPALTAFEYGDSTEYLELPAGEYLVEVLPGGGPTVAISATVDLMPDTYYSAAAIGDGANQDLSLQALVDDNTAPAAGQFHLRLGHLAPFAAGSATADVRLQDGTIVADDVNFGDVTGYLPLAAGEYDLKITTPDGATTLIDPAPVTFNEGDIVTAFATGEGTNQDLGVFAWPVDVEGFFLPLAGKTDEMIYLPIILR